MLVNAITGELLGEVVFGTIELAQSESLVMLIDV